MKLTLRAINAADYEVDVVDEGGKLSVYFHGIRIVAGAETADEALAAAKAFLRKYK